MTQRISFLAVALCFLLSGLAALIYQTAWTRELAFVFGTSELAVATVLAAYMAGLAAGAAVGGRLAPRLQRPVLAYGVLEFGVGASALAVPVMIGASQSLLLAWFGGQPGLPDASGLAAAAFSLVSSFLVLMLPTAFMGATLPLLARHAVHEDSEVGSRIGALYAINTVGAVAGTLLTAFALLPALGLRLTVWVAVGINFLVFAVAAGISRASAASALPQEDVSPGDAALPSGGFVLPLIAISGVVSFTYEVLWTRLLSHLLGGSVYAFSTMLASFLLGIAIGSAVAARLARSFEASVRWFATAQAATALLSVLAFELVDALPALVPAGPASTFAGAAIAMATLLPAALCIGATYPLAVRIVARGAADAAPASARTYAWNTAGAIFGALCAAYWLLPSLGFVGSLRAAAACNAALALAVLWLAGVRVPARLATAALVLAGVLLVPISAPWNLLERSVIGTGDAYTEHRFFAVGRSATVMVAEEAGGWRILTNGLPESLVRTPASTPRARTTAWMSALPSLLRDGTRSMAVVGFGGGNVVEQVPREVEEIHVIELEPEVMEANREIGPERAIDPLADPRIRISVNDARSALLLTGLRFDAVVAQASHPWTAGSSHLYTRDFFELVEARMSEGGIFVQWMGPNFIDEELLRSILATMRSVWPHVRLYRVPPVQGFVFIGSSVALPDPTATPAALRRHPQDFLRVGIASTEDLSIALILDEEGVERFAEGAEVVTDDRNLLQMRSPAVVGSPEALATRVPPALRGDETLRTHARGGSGAALVRRLIDHGSGPRARRLSASLPAGPDRQVAEAWMRLRTGRPGAARRGLARVLTEDPSIPEARAALLELSSAGPGPQPVPLGGASASEEEYAVLAAVEAGSNEDWAGLRALEPRLAAVSADSPFHARASLQRIEWRLRAGQAEVVEALALVDALLPAYQGRLDFLFTRARVAQAAGAHGAVLASARELLNRWARGKPRPEQIAWLRGLVVSVPADGPWAADQEELVRALDVVARRTKRAS